jgi:hypothetical protein
MAMWALRQKEVVVADEVDEGVQVVPGEVVLEAIATVAVDALGAKFLPLLPVTKQANTQYRGLVDIV